MTEKAEIIREKGTNRSKFFRGQIDKYTWVDVGSSYLPSELNAAYLWGQLENAEKIFDSRMAAWNCYHEVLKELEEQGKIEIPHIPEHCSHNAHMFWMKVKDVTERSALIAYLRQKDINAVFHYIPLHTAPAGVRFGTFAGEDKYTTKESERLLRLPLWYGLTIGEVEYICREIKRFYDR